MKKITTEQIEHFFEGRCTQEEAEQVLKYLRDNPHVLNSFIRNDWEAADPQGAMPEGYSAEMFREIKTKMMGERRVVPIRKIMMGVAAAVLLLVAGIWMLWRDKGQAGHVAVIRNNTPVVSAPLVVQKLHQNTSGRKESILLPDSSAVTLYANSSIRYPEPFDKDKRALSLEGKAVFNVAKDETRPFIVTAGPVITTVLGTEFSMMEEKGDVIVQLFSGKVRLHGTQKWLKDIVLSPGEQLSYTEMGKEIVVSRFGEDKLAKEQEEEPIPVEEQEIEFADEPLPQVMDKLASCYHLNITYNKKQIANMYFTGTVVTSDSITTILKVIANMNELKIVPAKNGFIIRKIIP